VVPVLRSIADPTLVAGIGASCKTTAGSTACALVELHCFLAVPLPGGAPSYVFGSCINSCPAAWREWEPVCACFATVFIAISNWIHPATYAMECSPRQYTCIHPATSHLGCRPCGSSNIDYLLTGALTCCACYQYRLLFMTSGSERLAGSEWRPGPAWRGSFPGSVYLLHDSHIMSPLLCLHHEYNSI